MIAWYAVYTRPRAEATAVQNLLRQGYQAYLPRYRAEIRHARRRGSVWRPVFPRYLFAGVDRGTMRWRPILSTLGVSDLVRHGDEPLPVPSHIVEALRERENEGAFDGLGRRPLRIGDAVRISAGAFEEMIGRLIELHDHERIVVLLDLLGRQVGAQVPVGVVEPV